VKVCAWCAEELDDGARRCTQCGRDAATRPAPTAELADGEEWWDLRDPDPASVFGNPSRPRSFDDETGSDLSLLEPQAAREQPVNDNALRSSLLAAFGSTIPALLLARRAERQIKASGGREGGMEFVTLTRVIVAISLGTVLIVLCVSAVLMR
jgi:hypothetical protein